MTELTDKHSTRLEEDSADHVTSRDSGGGDRSRGDQARPTPEPRTLAEALDVDPVRDDVKG